MSANHSAFINKQIQVIPAVCQSVVYTNLCSHLKAASAITHVIDHVYLYEITHKHKDATK